MTSAAVSSTPADPPAANVTLAIAGRHYAIACAEGEQGRIERLGALIAEKIASTPGAAGQGEARVLLFAALLLADELLELRASGRDHPAQGPAWPPARLAAIAERLEILADQLEQATAKA